MTQPTFPITPAEAEIFEWRLDPKEAKQTIYHKIKCLEYAPISKIYGFINNEMGDEASKSPIFETELQQMMSYKNTYNKMDKAFHTKHVLSKHKWGRITPAGYNSLSVLHRPTRHTLCEKAYVDLDIENAAPSIVREMSIQHGIACSNITKYCEDPKKWRAKIMSHHNCSKDVAKKLILSILNGGKYIYWLAKNDIQSNDNNLLKVVYGIQEEMSGIIEIVYTNNQHIKKDVLKNDPAKWKNESEAKRGVMGLWLQTIEKMIQETCVEYLSDVKNIHIATIVPCQDGLMILKDKYYDEICSEFEKIIKSQFNFNIVWKNKPFDEAIEIPEYLDTRSFDKWDDDLSSKMLGDKFVAEFGDFVVRNGNNVYVYWGTTPENNRWYDETNPKKRYKLLLYISENLHNIVLQEISSAVELDSKEVVLLKKTLRSATSKMFNVKDIITHIMSKCRSTERDFDSDEFLLGFENGVYDLNDDSFRAYSFNDYITLSTNYDYHPVDENCDDVIAKMKELNKIIDDIHPDPECKELYLQILASGLDGRAYQKLFLFNGGGGNGKGLTGAIMEVLLGGYYHQPSNGILKDVERSNTPSPDMCNLKNKRYINFKEVAGAIRAAVVRNLTGGGKFVGRMLNQNPEHFFMNATFVMEFNVAPELDGKPQRADYRRLVDINFPMTFTDDPNKIGKTIGGIKYIEANTYYETQTFLQSIKDVFLHTLLRKYKQSRDKTQGKGIIFTIPESVRLRTNEFIENQNLFQRIFNMSYEKCDILPDDKADEKAKTFRCQDVWETIKYSDEYRSQVVSFRDKRQYNQKQFYAYLEENYKIFGNTRTGKLIKGFITKEGIDALDVCSDAETENAFVGKCSVVY